MNQWNLIALTLVAGIAAAAAALAHDEKDPRHIAMTGLGKDMKAIAGQLKAGQLDADTAAAAGRIAATGERLLALFPAGSGGHHSRAKAEIWSDWAGFAAKNDAFRRAAADLRSAAADGDAGAVAAALQATGKTCKGCHQAYRKPKKKADG